MSIVPGIVEERFYEEIRDKIAQILVLEVPAQGTLRGDADIAAIDKVYVERAVQFSADLLPAINVLFEGVKFDNETQDSKEFTADYSIHVYGNASATSTNRADETSSKLVQRLSGIIDGVLSYGGYNRLGFAFPTAADKKGIANREVTEVQNFNPENTSDAHSIVRSIVKLQVRGNQPKNYQEGVQLGGVDTQVCLYDSNECYYYTSEGVLPPSTGLGNNLAALTINGVEFITVVAGNTTDLELINSLGDPLSPDLNNVVITVADSAITLNSDAFIDVPAEATQDVILQDQNAVVISPISTVGNVVNINIPTFDPVITIPTKTGQTTPTTSGYDGDLQQGRGVDFFTASSNNPFGNDLRWTGTTGTATIQADGIMLDWEHKNDELGYVHAWNIVPISSGGLDADIATLAALNFGGISNWQMCSKNQLNTLWYSEALIATNWPPLNCTSIIIKTNTIDPSNQSKASALVPSTHVMTSENKAFGSPRVVLPFRYILYSEITF
jgi:hypothetical protein